MGGGACNQVSVEEEGQVLVDIASPCPQQAQQP